MKLATAPDKYDRRDEQSNREELRREDARNFKRDQDVELAGPRFILRSPNGTRFSITVDNAGVISATAI